MNVSQSLQLLGGLSPAQFMQRHWQKNPLLVRQAFAVGRPVLSRAELFALAGQEDVQSRLVSQQLGGWRLKQGPFSRRALPPLKRPGWTLLVQGVDRHQQAAHELLQAFRFAPDCRLDDLMVSYASDGGGVGPHFDSYDVFLLQLHGQRRWRIGRQKDLSLQDGLPLKILSAFVPEQEFVLDAGDMLYLPPRCAHDGVALGECLTGSVGFRAPRAGELARELLQRLADDAGDLSDAIYRDPAQAAAANPAEIPAQLQAFAKKAVQRSLANPMALDRALGEHLTEPPASVWFSLARRSQKLSGLVRLDRRTKMMFDPRHIFINGEAYLARGRDAKLMQQLANHRCLSAGDCTALSPAAQALLRQWQASGWLHALGQ